MTTITLARNAMATRFELVLHGNDPVALRAAGEEALEEIDRLEAQLSLFRPSSEIAHLNARAAWEPVRVTPELFTLLEHAQKLSLETGGAFDVTIGPLVRCWGFMGGSGSRPTSDEIAAARDRVGMHRVELNSRDRTVRFQRQGMAIDLGAIGKGYAVGKAAELLRDHGVESALLHGGTSTVYGLGHPPGAEHWSVAIEEPAQKLGGVSDPGQASDTVKPTGRTEEPGLVHGERFVVALKNEALSVSAVWGKFFQSEGKMLGHVLNPLTGEPVSDSLLAAAVLSSATETDALSTALLALGPEGHDRIAALRPGIRTLLVSGTAHAWLTESRGFPGRTTERRTTR